MLNYADIKAVKRRRQDLKKAAGDVKVEVFQAEREIALDYIIHNNQVDPHAYFDQLLKNELRVKLKNAITQTWSDVKQENKPPSLNDMVDKLLKQKREKEKLGAAGEAEEAERER